MKATTFLTTEEIAKRKKQEQIDAERAALDDNPERYIAQHTIGGHAFASHVSNSNRALLNNVITGRKYGDTLFNDAQTQTYCIQEILYAKMDYLQEWVKEAQSGETTMLFTDFNDPDDDKPQYIGSGFVTSARRKENATTGLNGINYVKTNTAGVIVKKNTNAPAGWEITTAFPLVHPRQEHITEKTSIVKPPTDFKKVLHRTEGYQTATTAKKLYLDIKCSNNREDPDHLISYHPETDSILIRDAKRRKVPGIRIDSDLNLHLSTYNRPDIKLNTVQHIKIATETSPNLYRYAKQITQTAAKPQTERQKPQQTQQSYAQSVSDMQVSQPPQTETQLNY